MIKVETYLLDSISFPSLVVGVEMLIAWGEDESVSVNIIDRVANKEGDRQ